MRLRRKYRGFAGQVPTLAGLGWLPKEHATAEQNARYPDSLYFCGGADYSAYIAEHGAVPAGSSILGTGIGMPQICIDAGYRKEYVYGTGNILQTKITGPNGAEPVAPPPAPPTIAPTIAPAPAPAPTAAIGPQLTEEGEAMAAALRARQQELETRQAAEAGDGIVPELEARASVQEATRRAIDIGGGPGPGPAPPTAPPPPAAEETPNWLPLIVGAVAIYLMQ